MGFEDRDYFRARPRFGTTGSLGPAGKGMIIAIVAGYLIGLVVADAISFTDAAFWEAVSNPDGRQRLGHALFVLTARDIAPWQAGYSPGYWKLLTAWLVAPGVIAAAVSAILVYFASTALEEALGWKRFLLLLIGACVCASLLAGLIDPLILPGREQIVIMGSSPGIIACFVAMLWVTPDRPSIFGWRLRRVMGGVLAVVAAFSFLAPVIGGDAYTQSPTQLLWGIAAGAMFMNYLKSTGSLPTAAATARRKSWQSGYDEVAGEDAEERKARERERKALEKMQREAQERHAAEEARKARLDAILDKININGMGSLTRAEKRFLEDESKRKQEK